MTIRQRAVIGFILAWLLWVALWAQPADSSRETFVVEVLQRTSVDYRDIAHFDLLVPPARLSLMGDADLPIVQALAKFNGQKVRVTFTPLNLERIAR